MKKISFLMMMLLAGAVILSSCSKSDDDSSNRTNQNDGNQGDSPADNNGGGSGTPVDVTQQNVTGMWLMTGGSGTIKQTVNGQTTTTDMLFESNPQVISLQADNVVKGYVRRNGQWTEQTYNAVYVVENDSVKWINQNSDGSGYETGYQVTSLTTQTMKWRQYVIYEYENSTNETEINYIFTRVASLEAADNLLNQPLSPVVANTQLEVGDYKVSLPYAYFSPGGTENGMYFNTVLFSSIDLMSNAGIPQDGKWSYMWMNVYGNSPFDVNSIPTGTNPQQIEIFIGQDLSGTTQETGFKTTTLGVNTNITKSGSNYSFVINNRQINNVDANGRVVTGSYANISFYYSGALKTIEAGARADVFKSEFQKQNEAAAVVEKVKSMQTEGLFPLRR